MGKYGLSTTTKVRQRRYVLDTIKSMVDSFIERQENPGASESDWTAINIEVTGLEPHEVEMFEAMKEQGK